jgi:hypothetical protein
VKLGTKKELGEGTVTVSAIDIGHKSLKLVECREDPHTEKIVLNLV